MNNDETGGSITPSVLKHVDPIADQFDSAWQAALQQVAPPDLEDYLGRSIEPMRSALLRELVAIDIQYYARWRGKPSLAKYTDRFPAHADLFSDLFKSDVGSVAANRPDERVASTVDQQRLATPFNHDASTIKPGRGASAAREFGMGRFGDYELINEIARGGMGVVYKARQLSLNRIVAVKMILAGQLAGQSDVLRFRREAEAAAHLQHPNIVAIHEVGEIDGHHYFSMDYVEGESLASLIRENPLPGFRAARYVKAVAEAIHYAHNNGIMHRDLKPSNILVQGLNDNDEGIPRITDFGLARRIEGGTELTGTGQLLGTPSYMPPEQASGKLGEVGPLSDVYSLGATLYDLLTGRPPFRADTPLDTVLQVLDSEPVSPRLLNPKVNRDLETITLKCLQKDPANRYASAQELADDLERHLKGESIQARPTGHIDRLWRWSRRHPAAATAVAAIAVGLVSVSALAIALGNTNQNLKSSNESLQLANQAETIAKKNAESKQREAETARDETKQILDYIVAAFRKSDPDADGESLTVAALFGQAEEQLEADFPNKPLIQAELLNAIGQTYIGLGLYEKAASALKLSLDLRRNEMGEENKDTLAAMNNLAEAYKAGGRLADAFPLYKQSLELKKTKLGPTHLSTLTSLGNLANWYRSAGMSAQALPIFEKTLELMKGKMGPEHPYTLRSMNDLAAAYKSAGRLQEALLYYEQTLELRKKKLGPEHPDTLGSMNNLALAYESVGRLADALELHEQTLELRKTKLGPLHPDTLVSMNNLAAAYEATGRIEEALQLYEPALELMKAKLAPDHPNMLAFMNNLAVAYKSAGRLADAWALHEQTLELRKAKLGPDHPSTLASMNNLASAYRDGERLAEALPLYEQSLELMKAKLGPDHPDTLTAMSNLANAYGTARLEEALPLLEQTFELRKAKLGLDHPSTLTSMKNLASAYRSAERLADALPLYEQSLELIKAKLGPDHPDTLTAMSKLATAYDSAARLGEALPLFEQTFELRKAKLGHDHPSTLASMNNLASAYSSAGRIAEALPLYEQSLELTKGKLGPDHPDTFTSLYNLAMAYLVGGQTKKAQPLFDHFMTGMRERAKPYDSDFADLLAEVSLKLLQHRQATTAETYLRECLTIREKNLPDDWVLFDTKSMLGGALAGQKKFQEAETLLIEGYQGMKEREEKIPLASKNCFAESIRRLVQFYEALDNRDDAAMWGKKLQEFQPD
jgi:serine/threonine protein kinase